MENYSKIFSALYSRLYRLNHGHYRDEMDFNPITPLKDKIFAQVHPQTINIIQDCLTDIEHIDNKLPSLRENIVEAIGACIIALLTVSFQALKAALSNPIKSLRTE